MVSAPSLLGGEPFAPSCLLLGGWPGASCREKGWVCFPDSKGGLLAGRVGVEGASLPLCHSY